MRIVVALFAGFWLFVATSSNRIYSQSYYGGKFKISSYSIDNYDYALYDFSRSGARMRAKYFATDAHSQYLNWKSDKRILLVTAGAFSASWDSDAIPVGLCVDNGTIINKVPDSEMDGLVVVYNGDAQIGGIGIVDLDENGIVCGKGDSKVTYHPRGSYSDRLGLLNWGKDNGLTIFQTQLVYSSDKFSNFSNLYYGDKKERRFLAICKKSGSVHHVVVDAPDELELNRSAQNAKKVLEYAGFRVLYILNLDTGGKNVLHVYNGSFLKNLEPNPDAALSEATNLLIYYYE